MTKEILLESIVLGFLLLVYLTMKCGLSDLKSWLHKKTVTAKV